VKKRQGMFKQK